MSTNAAIGRRNGDGFKGVYHHWDGYPSGLGKALYGLRNGHFGGDTGAMLEALVDAHPAGWSTIVNKDFSEGPGFAGDGPYDGPKTEWGQATRPECFCHGQRSEDGWEMTNRNAADCGVEYAYAFEDDGRTMFVLSSHCEDGTKMVGAWGCGDPNAKFIPIAKVDLDGPEPDWDGMGA